MCDVKAHPPAALPAAIHKILGRKQGKARTLQHGVPNAHLLGPKIATSPSTAAADARAAAWLLLSCCCCWLGPRYPPREPKGRSAAGTAQLLLRQAQRTAAVGPQQLLAKQQPVTISGSTAVPDIIPTFFQTLCQLLWLLQVPKQRGELPHPGLMQTTVSDTTAAPAVDQRDLMARALRLNFECYCIQRTRPGPLRSSENNSQSKAAQVKAYVEHS